MRRLGRIIIATLAVIGLLAVSVGGLGIWAVTGHHGPSLPRHMVLSLDLEAEFNEVPSADPFAALTGEDTYILRKVVDAMDRAAVDPRVQGLIATMGHGKMGMAAVQELRDAVLRFRASGKPAVLFAETIGEFGDGTRDYYLASSFSQVWLQPSGDVGLTGFMAESPFFKGTLDLLGIDTQFAARKEYKTAIETFTERKFSAAHAETINALLDSWTEQSVRGIADARHLPVEKVRALFGKGPFLATEALSAGLVDKLGYVDGAWEAAAGTSSDPEEIDVADYAASLPRVHGTKVAYIVGHGAIHRGEAEGPLSQEEGFASDTIAQALRDAIDDDDIEAILFRVDSPGGSYVASDTVWHEVRRAHEAGKPVVVSMGDVAASGGYFVAMGADRIVAQPGAITGSIGVFTGKAVLSEFWQKLGVSWDEIHRGDNAAMWSANQKFSPQAWERVNTLLDHIYSDFTTKAAQGRAMPLDKLEPLARGRVWSGADAKTLGLVDVLGGYPAALGEVRNLLKLKADAPLELVSLPEPQKPWEVLVHALGGNGETQENVRALTSAARVLAPVAARLESLDPKAGILRLPAAVPVRP